MKAPWGTQRMLSKIQLCWFLPLLRPHFLHYLLHLLLTCVNFQVQGLCCVPPPPESHIEGLIFYKETV